MMVDYISFFGVFMIVLLLSPPRRAIEKWYTHQHLRVLRKFIGLPLFNLN